MHNPFWEEVQRFPKDELAWKYHGRWEPEHSMVSWRDLGTGKVGVQEYAQARQREDLCLHYSWSIPDPYALSFVARHLGPVAIEIGAGSGYWAYCLAQLGTYVICYDTAPPQRTPNNHYHSPRLGRYQGLAGQLRPVWREVYYGNHNKAARYTYPLFLCWPPYESTMAAKTLKAYTGNKLVYIGEDQGGCTADDAFFALLDKEWECIDNHRPTQWSGIHDWIEVYERKERKA